GRRGRGGAAGGDVRGGRDPPAVGGVRPRGGGGAGGAVVQRPRERAELRGDGGVARRGPRGQRLRVQPRLRLRPPVVQAHLGTPLRRRGPRPSHCWWWWWIRQRGGVATGRRRRAGRRRVGWRAPDVHL